MADKIKVIGNTAVDIPQSMGNGQIKCHHVAKLLVSHYYHLPCVRRLAWPPTTKNHPHMSVICLETISRVIICMSEHWVNHLALGRTFLVRLPPFACYPIEVEPMVALPGHLKEALQASHYWLVLDAHRVKPIVAQPGYLMEAL
ncbi:hypothetical protein Pfo_008029 [Paulownia fortunei]|nr:hypothetical protein Pfo_008029 [Paulownia fortunei]